jgi:hypothetical protein
MRPTPYVASLRVYEPIASFSPVDQLRWSSISIESYTGRDEQLGALRRTILSEPPSLKADGAHIIDHDGKRYVSPWSTARRCWAAIEDFKSSLPSTVLPFFMPESLGEALAQNSEELEFRIPHTLSETWMIPPRWFALFSPEERLRGRNDDGPFTIIRTDIASAKKRCITSHQIVKEAFGSGPVEQEIADLLNWLNVFHPESILECDYGGLAVYLEKSIVENGEPGLTADTSIEDVAKSLAGLAAGDGALAGQGYERLVTRWRKVASFEQAM